MNYCRPASFCLRRREHETTFLLDEDIGKGLAPGLSRVEKADNQDQPDKGGSKQHRGVKEPLRLKRKGRDAEWP